MRLWNQNFLGGLWGRKTIFWATKLGLQPALKNNRHQQVPINPCRNYFGHSLSSGLVLVLKVIFFMHDNQSVNNSEFPSHLTGKHKLEQMNSCNSKNSNNYWSINGLQVETKRNCVLILTNIKWHGISSNKIRFVVCFLHKSFFFIRIYRSKLNCKAFEKTPKLAWSALSTSQPFLRRIFFAKKKKKMFKHKIAWIIHRWKEQMSKLCGTWVRKWEEVSYFVKMSFITTDVSTTGSPFVKANYSHSMDFDAVITPGTFFTA